MKLCAKNIDKFNKLLGTVQPFSDDIKPSFGVDKCTIINIKKGKVVEQGHSYFGIETRPPKDRSHSIKEHIYKEIYSQGKKNIEC